MGGGDLIQTDRAVRRRPADGSRRAVSVALDSWPLPDTFVIAGHQFTTIETLTVSITDGDHTGHGEASGVFFLDDDPVSAAIQVQAAASRIADGCDRTKLTELRLSGGARNAVDCALWDLESRQTGVRVWRLAGLPRPKPLRTMQTISAGAPEAVARAAVRIDGEMLKLKLVGDDADSERIRAARAARPNAWIGIDANQGWNEPIFRRTLPILAECGVKMIEQPFPVGEDAALDDYDGSIPVYADESAIAASDIAGLRGRYAGVNIKLDKCGGLTAALAMAAEARRLGMSTMVGNMAGTSLATAPAFLVGQLCDLVDLDGPTLLARDRSPAAMFENGVVRMPDGLWGDGKTTPCDAAA